MEQTILTKEQKQVLDLVKNHEKIRDLFYLTGGTALSEFYLKHRFSDDLDFFTNEKEFPRFEIEAFAEVIKKEIKANEVEYRHIYDRRIFFFKKDNEELKMEFTYYPFSLLNSPNNFNGLLTDSLEDIAANKFMALMDRIEAKDFVDLFFLFKEFGFNVDKIKSLIAQKFNFNLDVVTIGSELAKVRNLTELPRMIKPLTMSELKLFFEELAKSLKSEILT